MFRCIVAKTPNAIAATEVKGHAQQCHIDAGISTKEQAEGNGHADEAAGVVPTVGHGAGVGKRVGDGKRVWVSVGWWMGGWVGE